MLHRQVAAAHHQRHFLARQPLARLQRARQRRRARVFGQVVRLFQMRHYRRVHLVLAHQNEVVQHVAQDSYGQLVCGAGRQAFGGGVHRRVRQLAALPSEIHGGGALRLNAYHLYVRVDAFGDDARAARAAAAADWDDYDVDVRHVFENLQRVRPDAGYQDRLVYGVDEAVAFLARHALYVRQRLVEERAVMDDLRAEVADGLHLAGVRALRDGNVRLRAEHGRGERDRLPVVAAGGRRHAPVELVLRELRHQVHPAAYLERADALMVFVLDADFRRAQQLLQADVAVKRRPRHAPLDSLLRLYNVEQCGRVQLSNPSLMLISRVSAGARRAAQLG